MDLTALDTYRINRRMVMDMVSPIIPDSKYGEMPF